MAELFKPEVRDIGGTNKTAYSPPSMNYSGAISTVGDIFKTALEEKEVKAPTEAERKTIALRNVSANMLKIDQIEDPTRKAVSFKSLQQNAYREYPMYVDDLNKFFGEVSGEIYPATGVSIEEIQRDNRLKWAQESPQGKLAISEAMMSAPGDVETQQLIIDSAYYNQQKFEADIANVKREAEGKKDMFELRARPMFQTKVDEEYQKMFKAQNIDAILKAGESPSLSLIDAAKAQRATVLAAISSEINKNGLDPTSVKPETFMTQFDALIGMLESNSTVIDREFKNRANINAAKLFSEAPVLAQLFAAGKFDPSFTSWALVNTPLGTQMTELINNNVGAASLNGTNPPSMGPAMSDGSPTDSASTFASRYENVFNRESLTTTFKASPAWKPVIDGGLATIQNYKLEGESPEFMEASHRAITSMFMVSLPEIDKAQDSMKPFNMKKLLSDKTFMIADSMSRSMPDKGMGMYNVINEYSKVSAAVLANNFTVQMEAIKDTEYVPFNIEVDEFGNLELVVNPEAARLDPTLKKAMGAFRYETKDAGRKGAQSITVEQMPTETDPKKILANYASLMEGSNVKQILDIVESMSILARTSKKIPDNVKQGNDAMRILQQSLQ